MLETYSRHVARHVRHPTDPEKKVTGIKVYRVIHSLLFPKQIVEGVQPDAEWLYGPYYQGEFDAEGNLKDPKDPYLYWLIPIAKEPVHVSRIGGVFLPRLGHEAGEDEPVVNFLERHARLKTLSNEARSLGAEKDDQIPDKSASMKDSR
jgi:hypothetical protein